LPLSSVLTVFPRSSHEPSFILAFIFSSPTKVLTISNLSFPEDVNSSNVFATVSTKLSLAALIAVSPGTYKYD